MRLSTNLLLPVLLQIGIVFGQSGTCPPQQQDNPFAPQSSTPPYVLTINPASYAPGSELTVTVHRSTSSSPLFRGFLVQARRSDTSFGSTDIGIGSFFESDNDANSQIYDCGAVDNTWANNTDSQMTSESVYWKSPTTNQGPLIFSASFVQEYNIYWESDAVTVTAPYGVSLWSSWDAWTECSAECGGFRSRSRTCSDNSCMGEDVLVSLCPTCSDEPEWGEWGSWSTCSCSTSQRVRTRTCNDPENTVNQCTGDGSVYLECTPSDDCTPVEPTAGPPAPPASSSTGLTTGAIVGIVMGVLTVIAFVIALTCCFCCCCLNNRGSMGLGSMGPNRPVGFNGATVPTTEPPMQMQPMTRARNLARQDSVLNSSGESWRGGSIERRPLGGLQSKRYY